MLRVEVILVLGGARLIDLVDLAATVGVDHIDLLLLDAADPLTVNLDVAVFHLRLRFCSLD
jgi:hypothetical protein